MQRNLRRPQPKLWITALALAALQALNACGAAENSSEVTSLSDERDDLDSKAACGQGGGIETPRMVWAVYYPWYRDRPFKDYTSKDYRDTLSDTQTLRESVDSYWSDNDEFKDRPIGPADMQGKGLLSYDPEAVSWQIDKAKSAGIDGFLANYLGRDDFSHSAVKLLLDKAKEKNFSIALHVSPQGAQAHAARQGKNDVTLLTQWIDEFVSAFGNHPAVRKVNGKVLAIVYSTGLMEPSEWARIRSNVDVFFVADNGSSTKFGDYLPYFDGAIGRTIPTDTGLRLGRQLRASKKLWMAEVWPGFDNDDRGEAKTKKYLDRQNGRYFQDKFDAAESVDPQWIRLVSWNEYYEHTHIEPSRMYGESYLNAAKDRIGDWKNCR